VLPSVGVVERETLMLAIGADELLIYAINSLEHGETKGFCANSPVHSAQYQQGNDTAFLQ